MPYRVISTTVVGFVDPTTSQTTVWEGESADRLSILYPPSEIYGADPLGHHEIEDGFIRTSFRFERKNQDGTWQKCEDPRRRLTPITNLEREIDAENRRLFPGDYEHEEPGDTYAQQQEDFELAEALREIDADEQYTQERAKMDQSDF